MRWFAIVYCGFYFGKLTFSFQQGTPSSKTDLIFFHVWLAASLILWAIHWK